MRTGLSNGVLCIISHMYVDGRRYLLSYSAHRYVHSRVLVIEPNCAILNQSSDKSTRISTFTDSYKAGTNPSSRTEGGSLLDTSASRNPPRQCSQGWPTSPSKNISAGSPEQTSGVGWKPRPRRHTVLQCVTLYLSIYGIERMGRLQECSRNRRIM